MMITHVYKSTDTLVESGCRWKLYKTLKCIKVWKFKLWTPIKEKSVLKIVSFYFLDFSGRIFHSVSSIQITKNYKPLEWKQEPQYCKNLHPVKSFQFRKPSTYAIIRRELVSFRNARI
jgi:hypothetical protein